MQLGLALVPSVLCSWCGWLMKSLVVLGYGGSSAHTPISRDTRLGSLDVNAMHTKSKSMTFPSSPSHSLLAFLGSQANGMRATENWIHTT